MRYSKIIILLLLCFTTSMAYQDYDIDGVANNIDLCPNTPFDKLVDENGCSKDNHYYGALTFQLGKEMSFNKLSDTTSISNFFVNYRYNSWDFFISNSIYTEYDVSGDTDIGLGYSFNQNKSNIRIGIGKKLAVLNINVSTGEDDYFGSINFNYLFNKKQNIFFHYKYTKSGDSSQIDYKNTNDYIIGTGYAINNKWYSSIAYEYSDLAYENEEANKSLVWFNSYDFSKGLFMTMNYSYALDDLSSKHIFSLNFGVRFE